MKIYMSFSDMVTFGGDPCSDINWSLIGMDIFSGEEIIYEIKIEEHFKNLFPSLPIDDGEDNRIPEITFDDVFRSTPWDFDFNFDDLLNRLMYEERKGITYIAIICPICKKSILEDVIIILNEDGVYFCSECNILLWVEKMGE